VIRWTEQVRNFWALGPTPHALARKEGAMTARGSHGRYAAEPPATPPAPRPIYAKAIVGALIAGLAALIPGLDNGQLSATEVVNAVIAALVALGAVWAVPK
jgi:hypothetical protein